MSTRAGNVRLVDFGLSKFCGEDGRCRTACGTVAFAAPEVCDVALGIEKDYDGHAADLWSLGCVLLELKTGRLAWDAGRRVSPGKDARGRSKGARRAALLAPPPNELLIADPGRRRAVTLSCDSEPPFVPRPRADAPAAVAKGCAWGMPICLFARGGPPGLDVCETSSDAPHYSLPTASSTRAPSCLPNASPCGLGAVENNLVALKAEGSEIPVDPLASVRCLVLESRSLHVIRGTRPVAG